MVHTLLETLGFSRKEVSIYLAILQSGKTSVAEVARKTGINRTTVYSVAKDLMKKGVIREDLGKKKKYLVALPPSELTVLTEKEERRLSERKRMIENAISQLEPLTKGANFSMPKITFIEEENLEQYLYQRNEDWADSIMEADGVWWGFQDHTFVEYFEEWIDWSWKQSFQKSIRLKLLTNQSDIEQQMKKKKLERRMMKYWSTDNPFTGTVWINGDYLILIVTNTHPYYLVEIHDKVLASNIRSVCKALWHFVEK